MVENFIYFVDPKIPNPHKMRVTKLHKILYLRVPSRNENENWPNKKKKKTSEGQTKKNSIVVGRYLSKISIVLLVVQNETNYLDHLELLPSSVATFHGVATTF
jgi:hypothetical protein